MAPINPVRIRLRYPDLGTFVEKFAPNVTRGGVFLASRNIQPVGASIAFEIQLMTGDVALSGQGKVSWVKEWNAAEPNRPYGMGVQFISVDPATRPILARLLRAKELGAQAPRQTTTTGDFAPVGNGTGTGTTPGTTPPNSPNGRAVAPPIDTSVDLGAEYGLADVTIRRMIERTWMTGARGSDDLADLLKPDPVESVTLAQALADLPRLLDPQYSRRRASAGYRSVDAPAAAVASTTARPAMDARAPADDTEQSVEAVREAAVDGMDGTDGADAVDGTDASDPLDAADTTDMTPASDTGESMNAAPQESVRDSGSGVRRGKKRRR